jgi:hypothetical protein
MKAVSKLGLLVVVALLATAAIATSAQAALTINPGGTPVSGTASSPTLSYGVATIRCDTGTADGNTTDPASDTVPDLSLAFFGNCAVIGVAPANVACDGTVSLVAESNDSSTQNLGTVNLNDGFSCVVTTSLCSVTVAGPQTTQSGNTNLDEDADQLSSDVDVQATRTGSSLCGPASGTANFTALYDVTPTDLTVDGTP